ncbi:hypothetical protein ACFWFI_03610 [Streptomyces sp. NPDC060209]|uniref:hypothetical protein n=1 Tax=Streptomyces sp. NPDC060209 TaxID=3347073 RepID=UPI00365C1222
MEAPAAWQEPVGLVLGGHSRTAYNSENAPQLLVHSSWSPGMAEAREDLLTADRTSNTSSPACCSP